MDRTAPLSATSPRSSTSLFGAEEKKSNQKKKKKWCEILHSCAIMPKESLNSIFLFE
jgi:hypothetical protein